MPVGQSLAAAREQAGLSVADVAEQTRIRATVIVAIEHDDFSHCGGDIYARGHVRSIARVIGVDPAPFVAEFDQAHAVVAPSAAEIFESETATRRERRGPNWSAVMVTVLAVALGVLGFQVVTGDDPDPRDTGTVAQPQTTPTPSETASGEPSAQPTESQVAVVPTDAVTLKLVAVGAGSWVQVEDSKGQVRFTGTLAGGQSRSFRDPKRLDVVVGNAAGIQLVVNGSDLGAPGQPGEVLKLSFRPGDPDGSAG